MNKVSFGYNPATYRTIEKKYADLGTIDKKIQEYTKKNEIIQQTIDKLKNKLTGMVQSFQNVKGQDSKAVKAEIKAINEEIAKLEDEMTMNKNLMSSLWYGYHERL